MVFSKSNIALLVLALGVTNISTSFAILPENDRVIAAAPKFTTQRIIDFIHGEDYFSNEATRQGLMRAAYDHLTDEIVDIEEDFEENWPTIVKNILGLAELLQNHHTHSLPDMSSYASARYVMALLNEVIGSPENAPIKHVNYAKIYWGQLLVKRIGIQITEEDKQYAWEQLSSILPNYTKIGNVYRASLLLEHGYIPEDVIYSEQGVAQIGQYAQDLLTSSYYKTRTKRIRALHDLASDRRARESQPAEVEVEEMPALAKEAAAALDIAPQNLTEQDARRLRAKLMRKAASRLIDDRQLEEELHSNDDNLMDVERSENHDFHPASGSKRSRDDFESSNLDSDSDDEESRSSEKSSSKGSEDSEMSEPLLTSGQNGSQDEDEDESESDSSRLSSDDEEDNLQDLSSSNAESRRSPIILSPSQLQRFFELYRQYSGPVLHEKLRSEVLTPEQSASFESNKQFKNWMSNTRITAQRKGLVLPSKTAKSIPFTDEQFTQIANQFQGGKVSIDDTFRRTVWTLLTEAQKSCFPEGYNSAKFKSYTAHQKVKFIASGITFRK